MNKDLEVDMTESEAINFLKNNEERLTSSRYIRIKQLSILALEKQIPKEAIREKDDEIEDWFRCPACNKGLGWEHAMRKIKYCYNCGQHIDTSEIEFSGENI